jgi:hypothetical protein
MADAPVKASEVPAPPHDTPVIIDGMGANVLWAQMETRRYYRVPLHAVKLASFNPRRGQIAGIIESLREFGQHRAAVVQQSTGEVLIGNHMVKAMQQLGWEELDVYLVGDDDDEALRRLIADNATGDQATWDEEELATALRKTGAVPGFDDDAVDKLLRSLEPEKPKEEPTYPLVARLNEHYDYVMIFCENETDWTWLQTTLQLRTEKSYKSGAVARSHVVTVSRLQELMGQ